MKWAGQVDGGAVLCTESRRQIGTIVENKLSCHQNICMHVVVFGVISFVRLAQKKFNVTSNSTYILRCNLDGKVL